MILIVICLNFIVGCSGQSMTCEVTEEEVYKESEGLFSISPNNDEKQATVTVYLEEKPTEAFRSELKSSLNTCEVDYILYFINPYPAYTKHYVIETLPSIIVGGPREKVLLKTSDFKELKEYFE